MSLDNDVAQPLSDRNSLFEICSITCFMMISETQYISRLKRDIYRYIPSTTQMMSTIEAGSVGFDSKRLTSALK